MLKLDEKVELYAERFGVNKKDAKEQIKEIEDFYTEILTEHQVGFQFGDVGKFEVNQVEEKTHTRRNPQTQETFEQTVPAHLAPKFKFGKGQNSVRTKLRNQ